MLNFEEIPDPEETQSPYNSGWRFWVSSGAAALLLFLAIAFVLMILDITGVRQ